jgi:UDP-N-acetylmuramyl pentapeptide phosphotransferase/UDP-N-acetylglucosamine-1-phosphate transferase
MPALVASMARRRMTSKVAWSSLRASVFLSAVIPRFYGSDSTFGNLRKSLSQTFPSSFIMTIDISQFNVPLSVYTAGLVTFFLAISLVLTKYWHGHFSMDGLVGVQKNHTMPTPRIGGVSVFFGVFAAFLVAQPGQAEILGPILLAGLPAFIFGLAEDVTKKVSVMSRLLATIASGGLGCLLTGVSLTEVGVPLLDSSLSYTMVSVAFTAFAVGGMANSVNIIDGFNGLASGFVVIAFIGLALLATMAGDFDLAFVCLAIAIATMGFWLVNWPCGYLFLGDGGSYFCGFALAWASVLLIERNGSISAFVPLLVCIHPVTEVLFSIYRRRMTGASPGSPDRLHLHTLVMRRLVLPRVRRRYPSDPKMVDLLCNSITGLVMAMATVPAVLAALLVIHSAQFAALACLCFALCYVMLYARLVRFHW